MFLSVMSLQVPAAPVNPASPPDRRNIRIPRLHHRYGLNQPDNTPYDILTFRSPLLLRPSLLTSWLMEYRKASYNNAK